MLLSGITTSGVFILLVLVKNLHLILRIHQNINNNKMMKHLKLTTYKHLDLNINQADRFSNGAFAALSLKL